MDAKKQEKQKKGRLNDKGHQTDKTYSTDKSDSKDRSWGSRALDEFLFSWNRLFKKQTVYVLLAELLFWALLVIGFIAFSAGINKTAQVLAPLGLDFLEQPETITPEQINEVDSQAGVIQGFLIKAICGSGVVFLFPQLPAG